VRQTQSISVDIGDGDAVAFLATVLAVEAVRFERDASYFNPRALLDLLRALPGALLHLTGALLNPFNWWQ
jgi:hypothetical protein